MTPTANRKSKKCTKLSVIEGSWGKKQKLGSMLKKNYWLAISMEFQIFRYSKYFKQ